MAQVRDWPCLTPPTCWLVPPPSGLAGFGLFPPLRRPFCIYFSFCSEPAARSNPAVLGVFVGSGLQQGAGGADVVHGGGPVQRGFSWGGSDRRGGYSEVGGQTPGFLFPTDSGLGGRAIRARRVPLRGSVAWVTARR